MEYIIILLLIAWILSLAMLAWYGNLYMKEKVNSMNAEKRALIHFRRLYAIENKLIEAEIIKEPAVITVDKIKELIHDRKSID